MSDEERQSGRTTKQIKEAPSYATYIVGSYDQYHYVTDLAAALGRDDLRILPHYSVHRLSGARPVVVDHATWEIAPPDEAESLRQWLKEYEHV